jgi:hypothetical protein
LAFPFVLNWFLQLKLRVDKDRADQNPCDLNFPLFSSLFAVEPFCPKLLFKGETTKGKKKKKKKSKENALINQQP